MIGEVLGRVRSSEALRLGSVVLALSCRSWLVVRPRRRVVALDPNPLLGTKVSSKFRGRVESPEEVSTCAAASPETAVNVEAAVAVALERPTVIAGRNCAVAYGVAAAANAASAPVRLVASQGCRTAARSAVTGASRALVGTSPQANRGFLTEVAPR